MSWRTVVITNSAKLDYQMGYMVVRKKETTKIHLSEVGMVIIESTAVSITGALLCELTRKKVKVIFCDEKRQPSSELVSYYGAHDTSAKIRDQIRWTEDVKKSIWTEIVTEKIRNQMRFLDEVGKTKESSLLLDYINQIEFGDASNREGHAAKVYFNALFRKDFTRSADLVINAALNYGYSIILSAFSREVVANGYITQLGLFHDNMFNQFNLASDLMEPFRILVDREVYRMKPNVMEHAEKMQLVDILNQEVLIMNRKEYVGNAIKIYCKSVFDALRDADMSLIKFYKNEL